MGLRKCHFHLLALISKILMTKVECLKTLALALWGICLKGSCIIQFTKIHMLDTG